MRLRERLFQWLPELRDGEPTLAASVEQATSFEAWDRLRNDQRLSRPKAQSAMNFTTESLLKRLEE